MLIYAPKQLKCNKFIDKLTVKDTHLAIEDIFFDTIGSYLAAKGSARRAYHVIAIRMLCSLCMHITHAVHACIALMLLSQRIGQMTFIESHCGILV